MCLCIYALNCAYIFQFVGFIWQYGPKRLDFPEASKQANQISIKNEIFIWCFVPELWHHSTGGMWSALYLLGACREGLCLRLRRGSEGVLCSIPLMWFSPR